MESRARLTLPHVAIAAAALAFLLAAQLHTTIGGTQPTTPLARQQDFSVLLDQLSAQAAQGRSEVATLKAQVASLEATQTGQDAGLKALQRALDHERALAGLTPASGPGITVRMDDGRPAAAAPTYPGTPPWIIHDGDLRDMVNAMWAAGAVAVSINGQRMVATSSIRCAGTIVLVNNALRLSTPYTLLAVGPSERLLAAAQSVMNSPAQQYRTTTYGNHMAAAAQGKVSIPAYDGAFAVKWAEAGP